MFLEKQLKLDKDIFGKGYLCFIWTKFANYKDSEHENIAVAKVNFEVHVTRKVTHPGTIEIRITTFTDISTSGCNAVLSY